MKRILLLLPLMAVSPVLGGEDLAPLGLKGPEHAVDRLVAIRRVALSMDPLDLRALAAAYVRLESDPASGFSEAEKVAILSAIRDLPESGPCACRALADPSRAVLQQALRCVEALRHAPAAPGLISLMEGVGRDRSSVREDLALAQQASRVLEILANTSRHFDALSGQAERQIALTRWRQWWEESRGLSRADWVLQGFRAEGIEVPLAQGGVPRAVPESVEPLLQALADARPAWIRENAMDLLSRAPRSCWAALAKGLSQDDRTVCGRAAEAFLKSLAAAGQPDLPDADQANLPESLKAWWGAHAPPSAP